MVALRAAQAGDVRTIEAIVRAAVSRCLRVAFTETEARRLGLGEVRLYTHVAMTETIALHGRLGFVETHRAEQAGFSRVFMRKLLEPLQRNLLAN